ncbi:lipopolysaccharide assembly protein LapB [Sediminibacter sp. Hel_I_10]|uniref:tetratricopeptide repeat protein n=1 Tax=Sediminibacter sp. Hel_I_10 TaxID=1392490 RepID=UPI00047B705E|nr:hypothetical protein [Sediminibacter sp. Hel_I_10]
MNSRILTIAVATLLIFSCSNSSTSKVTDKKDYNNYLALAENSTYETAKKSNEFWSNKLDATPEQYPYLAKKASTYNRMFSASGEIEYLKLAEENLVLLNEKTKFKTPGYLRSLAHNYISQHRFKESLELLEKAEALKENLPATRKMLFDVHLELGNYSKAKAYLDQIENFSDFDYLIRLAKWNDHKGNLDAAIKYMEKAMEKAESGNLKGLKQWSYTNIADFYGHAGEIEKSYAYYLKALELDPNDAYSKKGIAWILYSYEKNPDEALRILNSVSEYYKAPDYFLLKAEIADYKGDAKLKSEQLILYREALENKAYGDMYNSYNVMLYTDQSSGSKEAIKIAKEEVQNRPTPQSYDLLAWSYFKDGSIDAALQVIDEHVINKTFEPVALYHSAEIYKAAGMQEKVKPLKKELLASVYELGPMMEDKINKLQP